MGTAAFLLTTADAACIVAAVDRFHSGNWSDFIVVHVQDAPGGSRDLFLVAVAFPGDSLDQCAIAGLGPDPHQFTQGNVTITTQ